MNASDVAEILQLQSSTSDPTASSASLAAAIKQWSRLRQSQKRLKTKSSSTPSIVVSRSERAGIHFPVGRVTRELKKGQYSERVGGGAAVYVAAVLEYLTTELLDLAGQQAKKRGINNNNIIEELRTSSASPVTGTNTNENEKSNKSWTIQPLHLAAALKEDEELRAVMDQIVEHKKQQQIQLNVKNKTEQQEKIENQNEQENKIKQD